MQFIWKKLINSLKKQQVNTLKKIGDWMHFKDNDNF